MCHSVRPQKRISHICKRALRMRTVYTAKKKGKKGSKKIHTYLCARYATMHVHKKNLTFLQEPYKCAHCIYAKEKGKKRGAGKYMYIYALESHTSVQNYVCPKKSSMYPRKRPHFRKSVPFRGTLSAKKPYISAKAPSVSAREPYISEKSVLYNGARVHDQEKSTILLQKSHVFSKNCPTHLPKSPVFPKKSCIRPQKSSMKSLESLQSASRVHGLEKSTISLQKSHVFPNDSPIHLQKNHVFAKTIYIFPQN